MITDALASLGYALLDAALDLLPVGGTIDWSGVGAVRDEARKWNAVLPIAEMVTFVGAVVTLEVIRFTVAIPLSLKRHIPFVGGS